MDSQIQKKNRDNEIIRLFKEKKSLSEIARINNMTDCGVKNILKRNGFVFEKGWSVKWTKEAIIAEAKKYKSRSEFQRKNGSAYNKAKELGIEKEACAHMEWLGHRFSRFVYVCKFSNNVIYVGLSYDPKERFAQHLREQKSAVYRHMIETNEKPELVYLTKTPIPKDEALEMENATLQKYISEGFTVLNDTSRKAGQLGVAAPFYSDEMLRAYALKFKSRNELRKDNKNIYNLILRRKLNDSFDHMEWQGNTTYNKEEVKELIAQYKTIVELRQKNPRVWGYINRNGLQDEMFGNLREKDTKKYSFEELLEISSKYKTLNEFRNTDKRMFSKVNKSPDYFRLTAHMIKRQRKEPVSVKKRIARVWTEDEIAALIKMHNENYTYDEMDKSLKGKTKMQIQNKINNLLDNGEIEPNQNTRFVYTEEMVKDYIEKNNIKYRYGFNGLRKMNMTAYTFLKKHNLFEKYLPEDDGKVRQKMGHKVIITRNSRL
jgi:predicted GIY-YIG superfamily endonuclease